MTKTATRTDVHSPASPDFDPEQYSILGYVDFHEIWGDRADLRRILPMFRQGYSRGPHFSTHQCGHCGAHLRYAALMLREDTREIILAGETCLDNRFPLSAAEFRNLRENGRLNAERAKKAERIAALLEETPDLVWLTYLPNLEDLRWSDFLGDMYRRLTVNGEMSPRQVAATVRTIDSMSVKHWEKEAARIAREAAAQEFGHIGTVGQKITVTGKVVHVFAGQPYSYYGPTPYTYIVETPAGMVKIGNTTSKSFDDVDRGSEITVTGTVKAHTTYRDTPQTVLTRAKAV